MLKVYHSNRLERLLERLLEVTETPPAGALTPELIVTQSQGMARWLAYRMAECRGIAANIDFALPATFVWRTFVGQLGAPQTAGFDRETLIWRLLATLPAHLEREAFAPLRRYISGERPQLRAYQLCARIADVFDQYLVYRPQMLLEWEQGGGDDWQAPLWRALSRDAGPHRAALLQRFLDPTFRLDPARLPERVCLFGIPSLPPAYLEVLAKIADSTEVHLFALDPCLLYWGDIRSPRSIARIRERRRALGGEAADHFATGNPLLASMGQQGRDFIDALQDYTEGDEELFVLPERPSVLSLLQADILTLTDRAAEGEPLPLPEGDRTLQIHACHSPLREVEVLHDQLLERLEADPGLRPQDVVVMTPDIELYAPYIDAVFSAAPEARRIPYTIADLSRESEHPVVQAFLQLLGLPDSRFTANEVLSLLETPAVLQRFGLGADDFELARQWVGDSGIRWGLDAASRSDHDLPRLDINTWAFGFRRLFLGYAMAPDGGRLFEGVAPYSEVEGQAVEVLGRLHTFVDRLAGFARRLGGPHTAEAWAALVNDMLETFFAADGDDAEPLQVIRDSAAELVSDTATAGYDEAFGIEILRAHLGEALGGTRTEQRLLTGRLTFCAMIPMRSLPFRIVALIGMNDGAFPRQQRPPGFDRMAAQPRKGDRSRREEDRYLFLEALISAREQLYISYVGRDIRDNTALLPSVLVTELLDYVDGAFVVEAGPAREALTTEHPLQPFSGRYFGAEAGLYTYADEWLPAVRAREAEPQPRAPFCADALPAEAEPPELIELENLVRFFRHPARTFLRERLGVWLQEGQAVLDDDEPFIVEGLDRYRLRDQMLGHLLEGGSREAFARRLKAEGALPSGPFADMLLADEADGVEALADAVRPWLERTVEPLEVNLTGPDWRIVGWLDGITPDGAVDYRVGRLGASAQIPAWLRHLVLNASAPGHCVSLSHLLGEGQTLTFKPVAEAGELLAELVRLYREGRRRPLRLMPRTALAYVEAEARGRPGLWVAEKAWRSTEHARGEDADPDNALAFRGVEVLDDEFEQLAEAVYGPLLGHREGD